MVGQSANNQYMFRPEVKLIIALQMVVTPRHHKVELNKVIPMYQRRLGPYFWKISIWLTTQVNQKFVCC